jgi:hypothetical protein
MSELEQADVPEVTGDPTQTADAVRQGSYEPPSVTYLGTLRELTLGGTSSPSDGVGGAGGIGSL